MQFFVLSLRFMPPVAIAIPFIVIYLDLGIYDTLGGLVLVYLVTTISTIIWLAIPAFDRVDVSNAVISAMDAKAVQMIVVPPHEDLDHPVQLGNR